MPAVPPSEALEGSADWSADETIAAIRERRITASAYIAGVLRRAKKAEPLNAFITLLSDEALDAAKKLDADIASGRPLGPLAGLAIVAKDNINMQGLPTSGGTPALRTSRPSFTAPSLRKLITAGAIVVGKTNLHELAFGITSTNLASFAGPVHNPYSLNMIPGGSSGGTAVAISAGVVTCGLGTDTGGSTRIPAALTGTAGMRPSVGNGGKERRYNDTDAVVPINLTRDTVGAMGRTVSDIALLDSVISGRPRVRAASLRGLRLGVPPVMWSGLENTLKPVVMKAREKLLAEGVVLVDADLPDFRKVNDLVSAPISLHEPLTAIPSYLKASSPKTTLEDLVRGIASPDVKGVFDAIMKGGFGELYKEVMEVHRPALQRLYKNHFEEHRIDALLFPTTILPAIPIDKVNGSGNVSINGGPPMSTFDTFTLNTLPGSNAGLPGLSIPVGLTKNGLPVGLELDGPVGSDDRLLALGLAMERLFGRMPPPKRV